MTRTELEATIRDALTERLKGLSGLDEIRDAILDVLREYTPAPPEPRFTVTQDPDDPTKFTFTFDPRYLTLWSPP